MNGEGPPHGPRSPRRPASCPGSCGSCAAAKRNPEDLKTNRELTSLRNDRRSDRCVPRQRGAAPCQPHSSRAEHHARASPLAAARVVFRRTHRRPAQALIAARRMRSARDQAARTPCESLARRRKSAQGSAGGPSDSPAAPRPTEVARIGPRYSPLLAGLFRWLLKTTNPRKSRRGGPPFDKAIPPARTTAAAPYRRLCRRKGLRIRSCSQITQNLEEGWISERSKTHAVTPRGPGSPLRAFLFYVPSSELQQRLAPSRRTGFPSAGSSAPAPHRPSAPTERRPRRQCALIRSQPALGHALERL